MDVVRGHVEAGDTITCPGHRAIEAMRQAVARSTNMTQENHAPNFESGDYDGRPEVEMAHRMRRVEQRLFKFMRFSGFNPIAADTERERKCVVSDGKLYATGPDVTIGEVSIAANGARLSGRTSLYVGGHYWGEVNV